MGFVRASKAYILPTVLDDVYRFRKAFLTMDSVLRSIFSAISAIDGTAVAVSTLRGNYNDASVDCQGFQPSGYSSGCPWGLLSFIQSAASSLGVDGTFSDAEVQWKGKPVLIRASLCVTIGVARLHICHALVGI